MYSGILLQDPGQRPLFLGLWRPWQRARRGAENKHVVVRKTQINQKCFKLFLYIFSAGKKKKEKGKSMSKRSFSFVSSSFLVLRGHHQQINPMFSFFFSCVSWSRFRQCGNYPGPRYADEEPYLPLSQVPSVRRPIDIGLDLIASAGNK